MYFLFSILITLNMPVVDSGGNPAAGGVDSCGLRGCGAGPQHQLTPHRLVVVVLVREYCKYKLEHPLSPADRSAASLLLLSLVQSADLDLAGTAGRLAAAVPAGLAAVWAREVVRLQREGVAGVMDLTQSIDKLLTAETALVQRNSVLGLLLRRVYLGFDTLAFSEVSALRRQLDTFYRAGREALSRLGGLDGLEGEVSGEEGEDWLQAGEGERGFGAVSRKQADLFIAQQAQLLQTAEGTALPAQQLQTEVDRIIKYNPGLPEAHFLSYLNCARVREVEGALHSLYAAFSLPSDNSEESVRVFRYAALNLAIHHTRLEQEEDAMSAVREAITMAQEASDHSCLQHLLALLYRLAEPAAQQGLMERCAGRASQLGLPRLASTALLSLARLLAQTAGPPHLALDILARADLLNSQNSLAGLQATATALRSAVWSGLGRPGLAATLAQLVLHQSGSTRQCGEATALAVSTLALWLETRGRPGLADRVLGAGEQQFPGSSQWSGLVGGARARVQLWRAIARQDWPAARHSVSSLAATRVPDAPLLAAELSFRQGEVVECRRELGGLLAGTGCSPELRVRGLVLQADTHTSAGSPAQAVHCLITALDTAAQHGLEGLQQLACLALANCQLLMGCAGKALSLVRSCLPGLLAHASLADCARARLLAAKCQIAASSQAGQACRRAELLEGARLVVVAKEGFNEAGDLARVKDCLYLLARLYHSLQLTAERNMVAGQYKKLEDLYPVKSKITMECLN